jgi:hypothetical protein
MTWSGVGKKDWNASRHYDTKRMEMERHFASRLTKYLYHSLLLQVEQQKTDRPRGNIVLYPSQAVIGGSVLLGFSDCS